jgi:hypothetical protein
MAVTFNLSINWELYSFMVITEIEVLGNKYLVLESQGHKRSQGQCKKHEEGLFELW